MGVQVFADANVVFTTQEDLTVERAFHLDSSGATLNCAQFCNRPRDTEFITT